MFNSSSTGMGFSKIKEQSLTKGDLSRKGSVDKDAADVVNYINGLDNYFTTSSCSGRVCVFEENHESDVKKKGCTWLYVTHDPFQTADVAESLKLSKRDCVLKFEPFILHVQCKELKDAKFLHYVAVESGFRNSGITLGKNDKIITAIRSTHSLEVPLTRNGCLVISQQYLEYVAELANKKMVENVAQIERFFENLKNTSPEKLFTKKVKKEKSKFDKTDKIPIRKIEESSEDLTQDFSATLDLFEEN